MWYIWIQLKQAEAHWQTHWKQGVPGWHTFFGLCVAATCCNLYLGAKPRICNHMYLKVVLVVVYSLTGNAWASFRIHHCIHIVRILSTRVLNLSQVYYLQNGLFRNTFIWMHSCLIFWRNHKCKLDRDSGCCRCKIVATRETSRAPFTSALLYMGHLQSSKNGNNCSLLTWFKFWCWACMHAMLSLTRPLCRSYTAETKIDSGYWQRNTCFGAQVSFVWPW